MPLPLPLGAEIYTYVLPCRAHFFGDFSGLLISTTKDKVERGESLKKHNGALDTDLSCSPTVPFVVTVAATHF